MVPEKGPACLLLTIMSPELNSKGLFEAILSPVRLLSNSLRPERSLLDPDANTVKSQIYSSLQKGELWSEPELKTYCVLGNVLELCMRALLTLPPGPLNLSCTIMFFKPSLEDSVFALLAVCFWPRSTLLVHLLSDPWGWSDPCVT